LFAFDRPVYRNFRGDDRGMGPLGRITMFRQLPLPSARSALMWMLSLAAALGILKVAVLSVDAVPRIFMGDSGSYLATAAARYIPPDRSFVYGWLIRFFGTSQGKLQGLIIAQVAASAAAAWLLGYGLRTRFRAGSSVAFAAALVAAVEPLQLAYERFVMTEAFAGFSLAVITTLGLKYLQSPRPALLVAAAVGGTALLSLRLNMVWVTWAVAAVLPPLAYYRLRSCGRSGREGMTASARGLLLHSLIALTATACAHATYAFAFGRLTQSAPGYQNGTGLFALAIVAPLLEARHFPDPALAAEVLPQVKPPLRDPTAREAQRWSPEGLVGVLVSARGDQGANAAAKQIFMRVVTDRPWDAFRLGAQTLGRYFQVEEVRRGVAYDLGPNSLPPGIEGLGSYGLGLGAETVGPSPTRTWQVSALWWYIALPLCPLWATLGFAFAREQRPAFAFLALLSLTIVLTGPFLSTQAVIRYLHPLAWLTILVVGALAAALVGTRSVKQGACAVEPLSTGIEADFSAHPTMRPL